MKLNLLFAAAALGAFALSTGAHAAIYDLGTLDNGSTNAPVAVADYDNTGADGPIITPDLLGTDYFNFSLIGSNTELTSATITLNNMIDNGTTVDLTLYNGTAGALGTEIGSTGPETQADTSTLVKYLAAGNYVIEANISVPAGGTGSYSVGATVSAAPEPSTWAFMMFGVAMVGGALRFRRRNGWSAAAA